GFSSELLQKAQVVLVVQTQIRDAVLEHRDALDAHAPREALHLLGVVAGRVRLRGLDIRVDVRVDLPGTEHLEPALALAQGTARAVAQKTGALALKTGDIYLDAGLREGEEMRAQAHVAAVSEDRPREHQERALDVG